MASVPPIVFEVSFVVAGEMRWCTRATLRNPDTELRRQVGS